MVIRREDIGVYITLTLLGSGVGLLVGAYLESRKTKSIEVENVNNTQERTEAGQEERKEDVETERAEDGKVSVRARLSPTRKRSESYRVGAEEVTESETQQLEDGLNQLVKEGYLINAMQRELVMTKLLRLEDLGLALGVVGKSKELIPVDHAVIPEPRGERVAYNTMFGDVSADVVAKAPSERYILSDVKTSVDVARNVRLLYLLDNHTVVKLTSDDRMVPVEDIGVLIGEDTIEVVLDMAYRKNLEAVYVVDTRTAIQYRIGFVDEPQPFDNVDKEE